ncbi:MAG: division/cell wall cluster transcriptional repressor MraZ [Nitrospirota bacterium]|nr:division/cell wall cluster transcriptional repressor MraZ [Nitrospirota bacterium]GMT46920.1 MAG: transcriptional regulator MraZ [bacterium]
MPGFSGKYYYSVDPKGRVMIPAPYRSILLSNYSPKLYVTTAAFDKCLYLYPFEEWQRFEERVRSLPQMKESVRWLMRRVVASAHECEMDRQGRILIPASLRTDTDINGEVAVVGQFDKMELWNKKEWDKVVNPAKIDRKVMEEELASLGM